MMMLTLIVVLAVMTKINTVYAAPTPEPLIPIRIDVMNLEHYRKWKILCPMKPDVNGNLTFLPPPSDVECLELYGYTLSGERFNIGYIPAA